MNNAWEIVAVVFKNDSATLLARVEGWDKALIVPENIAAVSYSVYRLGTRDEDPWTAVTGHIDKPIDPAAAVLAAPQLDDLWGDIDQVGYNFRHTLDVSAAPAFPDHAARYLVVVTITPLTGQPIQVRWRLSAI